MQAIVFEKTGGPEVMALAEVERGFPERTRAAEAHRYLESRASTGKLILMP